MIKDPRLALAISIGLLPPIWAVVSGHCGITCGAVALICAGIFVTAGNKVVEQAIGKIAIGIAGGKSIADPMTEVGIFPPMVIQMTGVGEKTGNLGGMLLKLADFYDEEVDAAVDSVVSMIEPLIIVFLGGAVGGLLIAMYMPMFSMGDAIKG